MLYLDTSAFLKLVLREKHSAALTRVLDDRDSVLVASDLLRTEALRAARNHSPAAVARVRLLLQGITLIGLTSDICERAAELDPQILRSLDALHLASALALGDDLEAVVTYDQRLRQACELYGLLVVAPGERKH